MKKITFLLPDMAAPVLGPVTVIAKSLSEDYDVTVMGPDLGHGISAMYREAFQYRVVPARHIYRFPDFLFENEKVYRELHGEVVVAVKCYANTMLPAIKYRRRHASARIIAYMDEWDAAPYAEMSGLSRLSRLLRHLHHPLDSEWFPVMEQKLPAFDTIVASSTFLQQRFGGHVVPVGVDTNHFKPAEPTRVRQLKESLGLADAKTAVFAGAVRPHKGIKQILETIKRLPEYNLRLVIAGPLTDYLMALNNRPEYAGLMRVLGPRPHAEIPVLLSMADVIMLPSAETVFADSQVPCKIFEAMAAARPVIATAVSDLPEILSDCGWVVPPGNISALTDAVRTILNDPERAARLGVKARIRCVEKYSRGQMRDRWCRIIESLFENDKKNTAT